MTAHTTDAPKPPRCFSKDDMTVIHRDTTAVLYSVGQGRQCGGGIAKKAEIRDNLKMDCIPESMLDGDIPSDDNFLKQRRQLMAAKIRDWYQTL